MHHLSLGERIALNRSSWSETDLAQPLDGVEVWNRNIPERMEGSRARWIQMLLTDTASPASPQRRSRRLQPLAQHQSTVRQRQGRF